MEGQPASSESSRELVTAGGQIVSAAGSEASLSIGQPARPKSSK